MPGGSDGGSGTRKSEKQIPRQGSGRRKGRKADPSAQKSGLVMTAPGTGAADGFRQVSLDSGVAEE
jgi:hypothetical protein